MTTITTGHSRTPLIAALAVGAALVVGGAVGGVAGAAWEQNSDDTPVATQAHQITPDTFGGATTSEELSGSVAVERSPGSPGGATTSDELSGTTSGSLPAHGSPGGATTGQETTR